MCSRTPKICLHLRLVSYMVQFHLKVHHLNKTTLFKKIYSILYFTKNPTVMKINDISLLFV